MPIFGRFLNPIELPPRLCSEHFMKEKSDDPQSVDFVPTMFKRFEGADFSYIPWRPIKKFNAWRVAQ